MRIHPQLQERFDQLAEKYDRKGFREFADAKARSELFSDVYGNQKYLEAYLISKDKNDPQMHFELADEIQRTHVNSTVNEARELADQLETKAVSLRQQADNIEADLSLAFLEGLQQSRSNQ